MLPLFPSIFSLIGSWLVIRAVFRRKGRNGPYERLLLGMLTSDLAYTIVIIWSPFLTPSGRWWPGEKLGSETSCRVIGTLFQASSANLFYYGMLSFYFLITVRFQMPQERFEHLVEPSMHAFAVVWPVGTGIAGGIFDVYDELELFPGCWVDNYPRGCVTDCKSPLIGWIFLGGIMVVTMICLIVNNAIIVLYVSRQYGLRSPAFDANIEETRGNSASSSHVQAPSIPTRRLSGAFQQEVQGKRVRMVVSQATLYVATFFLTWFWFLLLQVIESMSYESRAHLPVFPLMIMQAFFSPLSGFWNSIIFFRPKYIGMRRRRRATNESRWQTALIVVGFRTPQSLLGNRLDQSYDRSASVSDPSLSANYNLAARIARHYSRGSDLGELPDSDCEYDPNDARDSWSKQVSLRQLSNIANNAHPRASQGQDFRGTGQSNKDDDNGIGPASDRPDLCHSTDDMTSRISLKT